jgi:speedy protein
LKFIFWGGNARYLAHDIEEDDEDMKLELYIWALGLEWQLHYKEMLTSRDVLWKVIGYRGIVSTATCEEVCTEQFTSFRIGESYL